MSIKCTTDVSKMKRRWKDKGEQLQTIKGKFIMRLIETRNSVLIKMTEFMRVSLHTSRKCHVTWCKRWYVIE